MWEVLSAFCVSFRPFPMHLYPKASDSFSIRGSGLLVLCWHDFHIAQALSDTADLFPCVLYGDIIFPFSAG